MMLSTGREDGFIIGDFAIWRFYDFAVALNVVRACPAQGRSDACPQYGDESQNREIEESSNRPVVPPDRPDSLPSVHLDDERARETDVPNQLGLMFGGASGQPIPVDRPLAVERHREVADVEGG